MQEIVHEVRLSWTIACSWGLIWYLFYASVILPEGESSYQGMFNPGEQQAIGWAVAGLTFACVYGATKAQGRWWEARGHVGKIVSELKHLVAVCGCGGSNGSPGPVALLAKVFFSTVRAQLRDDRCATLEDLCGVPGGAEGLAAVLCPASEGADLGQLALKPGQVKLWSGASPGQRCLIAWQWLLAACQDELRDTQATSSGLAMQVHGGLREVLSSYHGAAKVKMHAKDRTALSVAEDFTYWIVLVGVMPMTLARSFHVKLSTNLLQMGASLWPVNIFPFFWCLSAVVIFFGSLRHVGRSLKDPYGDHAADIKLLNFERTLFADLDAMVANGKLAVQASEALGEEGS